MKRIKSNEKFYQDLYRYDERDKTYIIEVSLDEYEDVYDEWDPSPFKKRDIEDEFDDFIWDSSNDIPLKFKIKIVLYLPMAQKNEVKEKALREAYDNFYSFRLIRAFKKQKQIQKKILTYLMMSLTFLYIGYFYSAESGIVMSVLKEGIFIGGWVFLWEVFTLIFITLGEERKVFKIVKRLLDTEICFIYSDDSRN
jgi:hypothetical protein